MDVNNHNHTEVPIESVDAAPQVVTENFEQYNELAEKAFIHDYYNRPMSRTKYAFVSIGNFFLKLLKWIFDFVLLFLKGIVNIFIGLYKVIIWLGKKIYEVVKNYIMWFVKGTYKTRLSYLFMGVGHFFRKRPLKAILYLAIQVAFIVFMVLPRGGAYWLSKFDNLGDVAKTTQLVDQIDPVTGEVMGQIEVDVFLDNSMLIMLYSVLTIMIIAAFAFLYYTQLKGQHYADLREKDANAKYNEELKAYEAEVALLGENSEELPAKPKRVNPHPTARAEFAELFDSKFHYTTLTIPAITIFVFTILPLVFMILLAFTNYDQLNGPPSSLFTWTGLETFRRLFFDKGDGFAVALGSILQWTFIWALAATFSNYIFGMILAIMINKKGIRLKKMWRTIFVITIAVPQFVTLLLMSKMLQPYGPVNEMFLKWGLIKERINFLGNAHNAKITVILVNMWVGVPYTMLITSGILMNIPADLYESARIDGAGPFTQFMKITLPYMLFVTGPYLITQFIGNINNFNVIFFLTGGGPTSTQYAGLYGETDILVTWLYKLTVGGARQEYAMGSALGIIIFLISAFISLVMYSRTSAATSEGDFA
jgi:arabinogalactan oligomer/maltooligosaccharide transport system permease protein